MVATFQYTPHAAIPKAQDAIALRRIFQTIHADSCPHHFNFHLHTICSDGQLQPIELMQQALSIGLQGLAITDHHSVNGFLSAQSWLTLQSSHRDRALPHLWVGVEVTSNLFGTDVHILGYAFDPAAPVMERYLQGERPQGDDANADRVIAAIQAAGGIAVLAHPARYRRSETILVQQAAELGIDGVETYYAYGHSQPWQPSPQQTRDVEQLSQAYNLLNTCGTDTHGRDILVRV